MDTLYSILTWHLIDYSTGVLLIYAQSLLFFWSYSFYWHCSASHKHFTITPWFAHLLRFWQWINSTLWYHGHLTKYTAEHRIHHMYSDTDKDPLTPRRFTLRQLCTYEQQPGAARYISPAEVEKYGDPTVEPTDPASMFYKKHQFCGVWISIVFWTVILGPVGFVLGYLLRYYHQYFGTFVGDWLWHKVGYKHPKIKGDARNICPIIFLEGLHSNHHVFPQKVNRACRWFEFDFFYYTCVVLSWVRIIKFNKQKD